MALVAVYGTLRKGMGNHRLMGDSKYLGAAEVEGFEMYPCGLSGGFPVILPVTPSETTSSSIKAEVFEVTEDLLTGPLDRLEGHPEWYKRQLVPTPYGQSWIYVMQSDHYKQYGKIVSGDFVQFRFNLENV